MDDALEYTALYDLHVELGAKMVPFAGYHMPVQYPLGVMAEHLHTRAACGLFDVSHMGQVMLTGPSWDAVALAFETLVPMDVLGLADGRQRYGFFTNASGGIEDDLMFARRGDALFVVVNAACKAADIAHMRASLPAEITVTEMPDHALIALQGPAAVQVLAGFDPSVEQMRFMDARAITLDGVTCWASRSGYSGEDGFELSLSQASVVDITRRLLAHSQVEAIGLGARNSLRLEAGLCLYGSDLNSDTNPVEAALTWAIQKIRRTGGARAGGFVGADAVLPALDQTPARLRVGLAPEGRAPMRDGTLLFADQTGGAAIGTVTSGSFAPTLGAPIAMGTVAHALSAPGTALWGEVRGKRMPVTVAALPFVPARFKR